MKRRVRLVEIWKPVVGYEDCYAVSNHGRVKRTKASSGTRVGHILTPKLNNEGYKNVVLKKKSYLIHRLVLEAFVGPCPPGHECNHDDGDTGNNCLWNLEWVTHIDNMKHCRDILGNFTKRWIVVMPNGKERYTSNLHKFCVIRQLDTGAMCNVAKGIRSHHKGWACRQLI